MTEPLLLPVTTGRDIDTNLPRVEGGNGEMTNGSMPRMPTTALHSLVFPSHRSIVENCLITFAARGKLSIDAQIFEQHRFTIESVIHANYRMVPENEPLASTVRHARADSVVVLGHKSSDSALKALATSREPLEFAGKLILTLDGKAGKHRLAAIALELPNVIVVSDGHFSTSNPELYQATRMIGKLRGITGSSSW